MTDLTFSTALPDPVDAPDFYDGILVKRGLAWVIDALVIGALFVLAGLATLTAAWFLWFLTLPAIGFLYRMATLSTRSSTWGMRLMGIEMRGHDGERFQPLQALLHVLGYYGSMAFVLPWLASLGAMIVTPRRQGLHDLLLGTAAINSPD